MKTKVKNLIVVSNDKEKLFYQTSSSSYRTLTAEEYLKSSSESPDTKERNKVFNLCNDYSYCKKGYYVSLLAEARGDRPYPQVGLITEIQNKESLKIFSEHVQESTNRLLKSLKADTFDLSIYFGKNLSEKYNALAKQIFNHFQAPLMKVSFIKKEDLWIVKSISPISLKSIPESHKDFLKASLEEFFEKNKTISKNKPKVYKYDLAILCNEEEEMPPSDAKAIKKFIQAANDLRIYAEVIGPKDFAAISKYDALFIRETTTVSNHTYKFSLFAQSEDMVVIDDPNSILRCCNKIYLNDYLNKKNIPTPKTSIVFKNTNFEKSKLEYPLVIKKPDSAFSTGVKKVQNLEELIKISDEYFKESDLLILQEYVKTNFDWRIGLIDGEPLYACKYYMADGHWQIVKHEDGKSVDGSAETLAIEEVPKEVLNLAKKACKDIGDGLYGVDIKDVGEGRYLVIEINDNPSIDAGVEDRIIGDSLYSKIMLSFLKRLESR